MKVVLVAVLVLALIAGVVLAVNPKLRCEVFGGTWTIDRVARFLGDTVPYSCHW